MAFLSEAELKGYGFKKLGKEVKISSKASIYNSKNISIGDFTRVDDFCIISAGEEGIEIGRNVHIACYNSLIGAAIIIIEDFAGISSHSAIYSSTDNYSGNCLTGPTVPNKFRDVISKPVVIKKHAIIGAGTIILPGVTIGLCSAVGALSLVTKDVEDFCIYAGQPAKKIKSRKSECLELENKYLNEKK